MKICLFFVAKGGEFMRGSNFTWIYGTVTVVSLKTGHMTLIFYFREITLPKTNMAMENGPIWRYVSKTLVDDDASKEDIRVVSLNSFEPHPHPALLQSIKPYKDINGVVGPKMNGFHWGSFTPKSVGFPYDVLDVLNFICVFVNGFDPMGWPCFTTIWEDIFWFFPATQGGRSKSKITLW